MNYFLLAETEFFRRINEAGDCNMEKAYTAFATQVIELCNGGMDMNLTVIALAYIEIDIPARKINVRLTDEELAARPMTPVTRDRYVPKSLKAYASMVSSADKGAVRII